MKSVSTHISLLTALAETRNDAAWADFVVRYGDLIRSVARRQGISGADQEDVLQDVLTALTSSMKRFEYDPNKGRFRSFLQTVTKRTIFARFRQNKRAGTQLSFDENTDAATDDFNTVWEDEWRQYHMRQAMEFAHRTASQSDLAAFRAYVIEGRSPREVAAALEMSVDSVYQAKSRLLKLIRDQVTAQIDEEG
ncbi:MAG: sigma-70 family RNA polymerase sigma factor [Planctomycetota bacterium]